MRGHLNSGIQLRTSEDLLEHVNDGGKTQQNAPDDKVALEDGYEAAD